MMPRLEQAASFPKQTRLTAVGPAIWGGLLLSLVASGCSRLTFVRPDTSRKGSTEVTRPVEVRQDPPGRQSAMVATRRAEYLLSTGETAKAREEAAKAVKLDPRSADAHTLMALALDRLGKADQAGGHYRKATELAPTQGGVANNYGTWLCANKRETEALGWFERALNTPGYATPAMALANLGACSLQAGKRPQGETYLRQAIELDPANPVALGALAEVEFAAGRYMSARAFSERRLAAAPAEAKVLLLASQIEEKLGDAAAAARYVRRLRAEFPDAGGSGAGEDGKP